MTLRRLLTVAAGTAVAFVGWTGPAAQADPFGVIKKFVIENACIHGSLPPPHFEVTCLLAER